MSDSLLKECFTFTWEIENFSFCGMQPKEEVNSPHFKTDATLNIEWALQLFPCLKKRNQFVVRLLRILNGDQTFNNIVCELSILDDDGDVFRNRTVTYANDTENPLCEEHFAQKSKLFCRIRDSSFLQDTLTIRCKICHEGIKPGKSSANLVFHQKTFFWEVEELRDALNSSEEFQMDSNHFQVVLRRCYSCYPCARSLTISQTKGSPVAYAYCKILYSYFPLFPDVVLYDGYFLDEMHETEIILDKILRTNDTLSLQVEFTIGCEILEKPHSLSSPTNSEGENNRNSTEITDESSGSLRDDMLRFYKDGKFCDVTLRSGGQSFHVHKSVICARSPVFCAMFDGDTAEARLGVVDIPDVDPDTLEKMLLFLYKDILEDIDWEGASRMYYVADKYTILPLKEKCLSILKTELTVHNACDGLALADTHQDKVFMEAVKDFICDHDEVLSLSEWKELEENHPRLTIQIFREMHLMKRNK